MAMSKNGKEYICQYELLQPFQNQDAGYCRWTSGLKGSRTYFIKECLDPIYPVKSKSTEERTQRQRKYCNRIEQEKKKLYMAISTASDGNLVHIEEFFRYGSRYYMTMPMIDGCEVDLKSLSFDQRLLICKTLAHSILCLHRQHIVHADIKASNVIMHRTNANSIVTKLIDFDCSFFESTPPESEEDLGGDQVYLSPEANEFIQGEDVELTCKMDVFSLGLLIHEYLTGELPYFDQQAYETASEAVLNGEELEISSELPAKYAVMIRQMLHIDPDQRWSMEQVFAQLTTQEPQKKEEKKPPVKKKTEFDPARAFYMGGDLI